MEVNQIPDVHSPDFPNSGVLKWVPDGPTVLARMDRGTVKTYTSFLAYTGSSELSVGDRVLVGGCG